MRIKCLLLVLLIISQSLFASDDYLGASKGEYAVSANEPIWFSGIKIDEYEFTKEFPPAEVSKHLSVANAGFWLANNGDEISILVYSFEVNVENPFKKKVYTRAILPNAANPTKPFIYEGILKPDEKSSRTNHNPVLGIQKNKIYAFVYEVYKNKKRTKLIDRIEQSFLSPLDNTSGCVEVEDGYKKHHFSNIKDKDGKTISLTKVVIACKKKE